MQRAGGESGGQGVGGGFLLRKPFNQFHGRGGGSLAPGDHRGRGGCGISGPRKGGGQSGGERGRTCGWSRGGDAKRQGDSRFKAETCVLRGIFGPADVPFHGAYDVELAGSVFSGGQPYGHGAFAAAFDGHYHGYQPEVLYKRVSEPAAPVAQHGYPGGFGVRSFLCVQQLCPVCHVRRPDEGRYGRGHGVDA